MSALRIGIAGMGAAGLAFIPALRKHPGFDWVAFAEPVDALRQQSTREHGVPGYASLGELLVHPGLDAIYLATPTDLHTGQVLEAASARKHVVVEKPMAVSMQAGRAMVEAAEAAGVVLVVGHSHSYDLPIRRMRELIASAERPMVVVGSGIANSRAHDALLAFAEATGIPVAGTSTGKAAFPETHRLSLGCIGRAGTGQGNHAAPR